LIWYNSLFLESLSHTMQLTIWPILMMSTIGAFTFVPIACAQIQPTPNGTGTIVEAQGNQINIRGGAYSRDGLNQFHQLEQFGAASGQTINFQDAAGVQHVITMVKGGQASFINGTLALPGSNANLYFINPAGIVFGANARLDLPGNLNFSTANKVYFGNQVLDVFGNSNYSSALGAPTHFQFDAFQPSAVINHANLTTAPDKDLTILAGTFISTEPITSPGGNVTIATVPSQHTVYLKNPNGILDLAVRQTPATAISNGGINIPTTSLPELLTGGQIPTATQVRVTPEGISLVGDRPVNPGDVMIQEKVSTSNVTSGNITIQSQGNFFAGPLETIAEGQAGNINIRSSGTLTSEALRTRSLTNGNSGNIWSYSAGDATYNTLNSSVRRAGNAGAINLSSEGNIYLAKNIDARTPNGNGGNVTIVANGSIEQKTSGSILPPSIQTSVNRGNGGNIAIASKIGDIRLGALFTDVSLAGNAGQITLTAPNGNIHTDILVTFAPSGQPGDIRFFAGKMATLESLALRRYFQTFCGSAGVNCNPQTGEITLDINQVMQQNPAIREILQQYVGNVVVVQADNSILVPSPSNELPIATPDGAFTTNPISIVSGTVSGSPALSQGFADSITAGSIAIAVDKAIGGRLLLRANSQIRLGDIRLGNNGILALQAPTVKIGDIDGNITPNPEDSQSRVEQELEMLAIEQARTNDYVKTAQLGWKAQLVVSLKNIQADLQLGASQTGLKPAIAYLELEKNPRWTIIPQQGQHFVVPLNPNALNDGQTIAALADQLRQTIASKSPGETYITPARALYSRLFQPIAADLQARGINTLILSLPAEMRNAPVAALMDGDQFLAQKYKLSVIPSYALGNLDYQPLTSPRILAIGVSQFTHSGLPDLEHTIEEIEVIQSIFPGTHLLRDKQATQESFIQNIAKDFAIVHLATHAEMPAEDIIFTGTKLQESAPFISLYRDNISLSEWRQAVTQNHNMPRAKQIELLFLGACDTASSNSRNEFGFSGLAVQSGVKTAIAPIWQADDKPSLEFTKQFYQTLKGSAIKAEALQQAQQSLIKSEKFSHPHYWAGFTLVGSPW
jgi:filamentous hemagglutinin family protein